MDPRSGRSDQRGVAFITLPAEGYKGRVPTFPLPQAAKRELEVWAQAWRSPQAAVWALPSESWRIRTVAMWVRTTVRCEAPDAPSTLLIQMQRFADQIGMTPAGMLENRWQIATDEVAAKRTTRGAAAEPPRRRRLREDPSPTGTTEITPGGRDAP